MIDRSSDNSRGKRRKAPAERRPPKPLDPARLHDLAIHYVARFSTTAAKLEAYLARKLRERGWEADGPADAAGIAARFVELGYIDDEAYARAKSGSLLRRGYGRRRIGQALHHAGVAEEVRETVAPGESAQRRAAFALIRKRRFGPFAAGPADRPTREKQLAAMLRAGHPMDMARFLVNAETISAVEDWAAECDTGLEDEI